MPRVFRPRPSADSPYQTDLVEGLIQVEIVLGGMILAAGGFILRESGRYDGLVLGGTLLVLGLYRLWVRYGEGEDSSLRDRVLVQLRRGLSANHTVALDYPLNGQRIPYLILAPAGIFVVGRFVDRGYYSGEPGGSRWERWPGDPGPHPAGDAPETVPNPVRENKRRVDELRRFLRRRSRAFQDLEPVNRVVVSGGVEGPVREFEELCTAGELPSLVRGHEPGGARLEWDDVNDLEETLALGNYR